MLKDQTLPELAVTMATLARAAYEDDNKEMFASMGFTKYKFMDNDGAQGHLAASKTEVVITCRGTEPNRPNDLIADLNTIPKRNGVGWVHEGFRKEARKILDQIFDWVSEPANHGKDIYVTGHSLGAAMALYVTQELEFAGYNVVKLFTFGQPRLGNRDYVNQIKTDHYRFVNCNDFVTHVPPAAMQFVHHGELCYINFYGNVRPLSSYQRFKDMLRAHWRALKKFELFDALRDHSMDNYVNKLTNIRDTGQGINR